MPARIRPHRGPNGLVIGPQTGQINPAALGVAAVVAEPSLSPSAARIFASTSALAAAIACDSLISPSSCCFVITSECDFPPSACELAPRAAKPAAQAPPAARAR